MTLNIERSMKSLIFVVILVVILAGIIPWENVFADAWVGQPHSQISLFSSPIKETPPQVGESLFSSPIGVSMPDPANLRQAQIALQYVAKVNNVSPSDLVITDAYYRPAPLLGQEFLAVQMIDIDVEKLRSFRVLVDMSNDRVIEDVETVEKAESEAYYIKYGKLHPLLYERLAKTENEEMFPVAIWVNGQEDNNREEIYTLLAERYNAVKENIAEHKYPFDIQDVALAEKIQTEYESLLQARIIIRIEPLAANLKDLGFEVKTPALLPALVTTMTKSAILEVAKRDDVQRIYLVDGEPTPELDTAMLTNRVYPVWQAGIDGSSGGGKQ